MQHIMLGCAEMLRMCYTQKTLSPDNSALVVVVRHLKEHAHRRRRHSQALTSPSSRVCCAVAHKEGFAAGMCCGQSSDHYRCQTKLVLP